MSTPPLLLGAALLFWGWQAGLLAFALPMALVLEGARRVSWRWEFSDRDFNRLADLSNLLFVLAAVYLFSREGARGVFVIATWLPMLLFLIPAAQVYSTRGDMGLSALFLSLRRRTADPLAGRRVDLAWPYFALCLVAASTANPAHPWFFPGALALVAWALFGARPRRYALPAWVGFLLVAACLGYVGQLGARAAQAGIEEALMAWFEGRLWSRTDPYRATTAIGHIGRLKFSDRIILHVRFPEGRQARPMLLRQASYQNYSFGMWTAGNGEFTDVRRGRELGTWHLQAAPAAAGARVTVSGALRRGRGVLALPGGAYRIDHLTSESLRHNPYGAVKIEQGPGFVSFQVGYGENTGRDRPPEEADTTLPASQGTLIERVAADIGLPGQTPAEAISRLARHLSRNFSYSLYSRAALGAQTPLASFLLEHREGHCEYFATATVLLLRAAGIPARYATGYSVQEYNPLVGSYVVRKRHAHAWAMAHVDGRWLDVDLTPAVWAGLEQDEAPWWEPAYDLLSLINFGFQRWRWTGEEEEASGNVYLWLLIPLGLILAWRLYKQKKVARPAGAPTTPALDRRRWPGSDSPFYRLLAALEKDTVARRPGETPAAWLARRASPADGAIDLEKLRRLLHLHYRWRFDPLGIGPAEREELASEVERYLRKH